MSHTYPHTWPELSSKFQESYDSQIPRAEQPTCLTSHDFLRWSRCLLFIPPFLLFIPPMLFIPPLILLIQNRLSSFLIYSIDNLTSFFLLLYIISTSTTLFNTMDNEQSIPTPPYSTYGSYEEAITALKNHGIQNSYGIKLKRSKLYNLEIKDHLLLLM
jgi:hypothetical protein